MKYRWAPAFTIVELLLVVVVIAILAAITIVSFNGIQNRTVLTAINSDLTSASKKMEQNFITNGTYPTQIPGEFTGSNKDISLSLVRSGMVLYYGDDTLTEIQNGVLFSQICNDLINEGQGTALNASGNPVDYIMNCGNWNHDSIQVTAYDTEVWDTPLTLQQLTDYANTFTANNASHPNHQTTVRNFYNQLIERQVLQGGTFPINSFWDYWATPQNGGVQSQPIGEGIPKHHFCIEATSEKRPTLIWHIDQTLAATTGNCDLTP